MSHSKSGSDSLQDSVESSIHALAQDLLSRDPTRFNSCINHNFESQATYKGHGLVLQGVSNIKHSAALLNTLDGGKAAVIKRENVVWDPENTTATIHSTRFLRPILSPISLSLPVKTVLKFNTEDAPEVDGSTTKASKIPGESLFITSFEEEWPIEGLVRKIPVINSLFRALYVPIFTFFVLTSANFVFSIQSRLTTHYHSPKVHELSRKANQMLGPAAKQGFEAGKDQTDKIVKLAYSKSSKILRPPLRIIETGLQNSTSIINFVLPSGLIQLPWPSIFDENSIPPSQLKVTKVKESKFASDKDDDKPSSFAASLKNAEESAPPSKRQKVKENVPPAQDTTAPIGSSEIPSSHATVLVGPSLDGKEPAKEFSIPQAHLSQESAIPHVIEPPSEKESQGKGSLKRKGSSRSLKSKGSSASLKSKDSAKERPKTLFDRIEMPKPSAEASVSLGSATGGGNVEPTPTSNSGPTSSKSGSERSESPTTSIGSASPAVSQLEKEKKKESSENHEGAVDPATTSGANKGSQKKKNNRKKKSGRGGRGGGATGGQPSPQQT